MNMKAVLILVAVVVVLAGGALIYAGSNSNNDSAGNTQSTGDNGSQSSQSSQSMDDMQMSEQGTQGGSSDNSADSSQASATNEVTISNYAFSPKTITVKVGTKVTWTNQDTVKHDVTTDDSSGEGPSSELLGKGESYSYTFEKAGTYNYHCSPHPYMKATVVVTE